MSVKFQIGEETEELFNLCNLHLIWELQKKENWKDHTVARSWWVQIPFLINIC